jgi:uncharacterized damage-inducible protein DinB
MMPKYLPIEKILTILKETPERLALITAELTPEQLHTAPSAGEWSINEVLAHLRACNEVWGGKAAPADTSVPRRWAGTP